MHYDAKAGNARDCCAGGKRVASAGSSDVDDTATGRYRAEQTVEEYAVQSDAVRASVQEQAESADQRNVCHTAG